MSQSQYKRGQFIKSRMMHYNLMACGTTEEFGRIYDLISFVETSGSTHNEELAKEPFYLQALKDWQKVKERRVKKYEQKTL